METGEGCRGERRLSAQTSTGTGAEVRGSLPEDETRRNLKPRALPSASEAKGADAGSPDAPQAPLHRATASANGIVLNSKLRGVLGRRWPARSTAGEAQTCTLTAGDLHSAAASRSAVHPLGPAQGPRSRPIRSAGCRRLKTCSLSQEAS